MFFQLLKYMSALTRPAVQLSLALFAGYYHRGQNIEKSVMGQQIWRETIN
jgi:hypothetical protein